MINSVKITNADLIKLKSRISQDYGSTILLIRDKCKQKLGFTIRYHERWEKLSTGRSYLHEDIYLDFFSEPLQTMFFLRYSDIINNT